MAVYGDVIRPGNQCRCRTVAEMLGQFKSKDRMAACKLPYNDESLQQTTTKSGDRTLKKNIKGVYLLDFAFTTPTQIT